jgi:hypothetical protein
MENEIATPIYLFVFLILSRQYHTIMNIPLLSPLRIIVSQKRNPIVGGNAALEILIKIPDLLTFVQTPNLIVVAE